MGHRLRTAAARHRAAVNTWNARRAAVLSWLGWCAEHGYDGPAVPAWVKRMTPPDSETPARPKVMVDRLIARREVPLREKALWRMLYETCARAEEILGVNIEDLDLPGRRAPVKADPPRDPSDGQRLRYGVFPASAFAMRSASTADRLRIRVPRCSVGSSI